MRNRAQAQVRCDVSFSVESYFHRPLNRQEPVEEGPIPAEGDAEVFRRNVVGLVPFRLQLVTLGGKDFRQAFDRAGHELVRLFVRRSAGDDRLARAAYKTPVASVTLFGVWTVG